VTTFEHREEHAVLTRSTEIFAVHPAGLCAYCTTVVQCMASEVLTVTSWLFTCHLDTHYVRITDMLSHLWNSLLYVCCFNLLINWTCFVQEKKFPASWKLHKTAPQRNFYLVMYR